MIEDFLQKVQQDQMPFFLIPHQVNPIKVYHLKCFLLLFLYAELIFDYLGFFCKDILSSRFRLSKWIIGPYKNYKYYLHDYYGMRFRGSKEIFNHSRSSLWNVVERCFGILKARFSILKYFIPYYLNFEMPIVVACVTSHNFI